VAIADASAKEGKAGTASTLTFVVSLSGSPVDPVTVSYATRGGSASAGSDFVSASGTLKFPVGVSTQAVKVSAIGDAAREASETFAVDLSNASPNAYLGDGQALGTILNDD